MDGAFNWYTVPVFQEKHRSAVARDLMKHAFGSEERMTATYNFALLDLAFLVCKRSNPECVNCPLCDVCRSSIKFYGKDGVKGTEGI